MVNAVTLTETVRGTGRDTAVHRLTRNAHLDAVDAAFAVDAGRLLGRTRRDEPVDALVATTAIRLARPVINDNSNALCSHSQQSGSASTGTGVWRVWDDRNGK